MIKLTILIMTILFAGCSYQSSHEGDLSQGSDQASEYAVLKLPAGATDIVKKGNGWVSFSLDGDKFLFLYISPHGAALTQIIEE